MTKRILQTIKLDKIAAVDNPCQEGAVVSIMKRAPTDDVLVGGELKIVPYGDEAIAKRVENLRHTILGATFVVNTLLKQGYYARMKHPDGSIKNFECDTSNRQVARARALATHPGHSIIHMHEKNLKKAPNPMLTDNNAGARRGKQGPRSARQLSARPIAVVKTRRLFPDLKAVRTKSGLKGGRKPADVYAQSDRLQGESGTNRKPMLMEKAWSDAARAAAEAAREAKRKQVVETVTRLRTEQDKQEKAGAPKKHSVYLHLHVDASGKPTIKEVKPTKKQLFQPRLNRQQRILVKLNHVVDRTVMAKQDPVEIMRKVIGNTAADYIHDFVNSDNPKFKGKSKQERIKQALGAYYGKN